MSESSFPHMNNWEVIMKWDAVAVRPPNMCPLWNATSHRKSGKKWSTWSVRKSNIQLNSTWDWTWIKSQSCYIAPEIQVSYRSSLPFSTTSPPKIPAPTKPRNTHASLTGISHSKKISPLLTWVSQNQLYYVNCTPGMSLNFNPYLH